jgi:hypothetical protein
MIQYNKEISMTSIQLLVLAILAMTLALGVDALSTRVITSQWGRESSWARPFRILCSVLSVILFLVSVFTSCILVVSFSLV